LLVVTLALSIALALLPLAGIALILLAGSITSVDGLFMSLILLTLSGVFFFNLFLEVRERGLLGKPKAAAKAPSTSSAE
jgi:uncharacterized membrane protein